MADPNPLELTIQSFSPEQLSIKVKNISGVALERSLSIELYVPSYLVNSKIKDAAKAAATNKKPLGVATLAGVVTGPDSWSLWAKRETSDSSVVILLLNDFSQSGTNVTPPIKVAAGAEFIIRMPLNPQASRATVNILYSYLHGTDEKKDKRVDGKLELKWTDTEEWVPDVTLSTNHPNPTMIPAGSVAKIKWHINDGVSAVLRGPLPGGNRELEIKPNSAEFTMPDGYIEVLVISGMTYILQAQVKRPNNKPNIEVVRMLLLDTDNHQYSYIAPHPRNVLPYGLIKIDWAAWGVREAIISVSGHTTRKIPLTQQTLGHFYEGSGIMRVVATREIDNQKTKVETITIKADPAKPMTETVQVTSWIPMEKPVIDGSVLGMAVIAPTMAVLTEVGLYVADVMMDDPTPPLTKLSFNLKQPADVYINIALTAVDQRFAYLRMHTDNANFEIVPTTSTGNTDAIPRLTLPPDVRPVGAALGAVIDFVGRGERVYVVFESPRPLGAARVAYSVGFTGGKADLRKEPALEALIGYRLVTFDDALYALNRKSGRMFRFDVKAAKLEPPKQAASAIKPEAQGQSMVADGMLVPVDRVLVVMNPTSVPSVDSLEQYELQNTLSYTGTTSQRDAIPQDLVYNPQRDYWARCGHDIDVKKDTRVAFRGGDSTRLWIIQGDNRLQSLAAGDESLFAHDYVTGFPTKTLPPYLNKKRQFKITNNTGMKFLSLNERHHKAGLTDFSIDGPGEVNSEIPDPFRSGKTEVVEITYNGADPSPVRLRLWADTAPGVKHEYLLEITFSGPDLANATSVFKRLAVNEHNAMSAAEIPGATQQHSTANPIVIAPPKPMVEGVKFRAQNATTYQFWREAPGAERDETLNRYSGEEISITYNTPAFYISAYGAGQLDVNIDFSLPPGIEISSGAQAQTKLVRINTDKSVGLQPELLPNKNETSYECFVTFLRKQEVKDVYIGDGVATERGESIFLPVAIHDMQVFGKVLKIDPENLSITESSVMQNTTGGGVFATPNSIALSSDYIFAMLGNTDVYVLDYSLRILKDKADVTDSFAVVTGIGCAYNNETVLLGVKKDRTTVQNINSHYSLVAKIIAKTSSEKGFATANSREVSLDTVKGFREQNRMAGYPAWVSSRTVSPMALSTSIVAPGGDRIREVAVCIDGGLFVVGKSDKPIRELALESAGREEGIVFGREGKSIYCLHSQGENQGLRLSRVDNVTWKQTHGLSLPRGEGVADLATDTRQRHVGTSYKNYRSASIAISLDEKLLFVSHGRSIFKIDVAKMELRGTFKTELPCRVFHVWWGKPTEGSHGVYGTPSSCTLLYAIGASYNGDGRNSKDFKTHLYKLAIKD